MTANTTHGKRRIYKESGLSPLISCLEDANDNYYTMELLLEDGWDPNQCINNDVQLRYKDGRKTALYFAVLNNNEDAVELLLQYGAKVNLGKSFQEQCFYGFQRVTTDFV